MIPSVIKVEVEQALGEKIVQIKPQSGGDINVAAIVCTDCEQSYFLKWNEKAPNDMFESEAAGLLLLNNAGSKLIIPKVIAVGLKFLVLSLVKEVVESNNKAFQFGQELAAIHKFSNPYFGLDYDNYIGKLRQRNSQSRNWAEFFIEQRIAPQIEMGIEKGLFASSIRTTLGKLQKVVENEFPTEKPALVHGDLWSGNYMFTEAGTSIYDPAVYFGHREMDIAMTKLFGGFSAVFYEGYESEFPLEVGFEARQELCNLYPLLVHANLFGGSYVHASQRIINHYAKP